MTSTPGPQTTVAVFSSLSPPPCTWERAGFLTFDIRQKQLAETEGLATTL